MASENNTRYEWNVFKYGRYTKDWFDGDYGILIDREFKKCDENPSSIYDREIFKISDEVYMHYDTQETLTLCQKELNDKTIKYFNEFLYDKSPIFKRIYHHILLVDYQERVKNTSNLILDQVIVDDKLINYLKTNFKNLKRLTISNSIIKTNNLYLLNLDHLKVSNSTVNDFNVFNYLNAQQLIIKRITVNHFNHHNTIYTTNLGLDNIDDKTLENIFLYNYFPVLKELTIGDKSEFPQNLEFNKALLFLPKATPNLQSIYISGKVYSFNFLTKMNRLYACDIKSISHTSVDDCTILPYVTCDQERKDIIKHNKYEFKDEFTYGIAALPVKIYEKDGIYYRDIDNGKEVTKLPKRFKDDLEAIKRDYAILERLYELIKITSLINYNETEKNMYLKKKLPTSLLDPLHEFSKTKLESYYIYNPNDQSLIQEYNTNNNFSFIDGYPFYTSDKLTNKYLGITCKKGLDLMPLFIYHPNGKVIIIKKSPAHQKDYESTVYNNTFYFSNEEFEQLHM